MTGKLYKLSPLAVAASAVVLASCGGGNDATTNAVTPAPAPAAQTRTLSGTAATGAAFAGGNVSIIDATGAPACASDGSSLTTNSAGTYTCVLTAGARGPFAIVVSDPNNVQRPQVAVVAAAPEPGQTGVGNITPLTTAQVAIATGKVTLAELVGSPAAIQALTATSATDLRAALATLKAQILPLLAEAGINPDSFDPATTPIVAGSGQGSDRVLDSIRVTETAYPDASGTPRMVLTLSTPLAPNAPPVPLGTKGDTTATPVATPTVSGVDFTATSGLGAQFAACFSHPVGERAPGVDTSIPSNQGGPEVTGRHADCNQIPIEAGFINSGYRPWQLFYTRMTSDDMTGAKFNTPELMSYFPQTTGDLAVLNFKYVDNKGIAGNFILNVRKQSDGKWALSGNSRTVEISVTPTIRRREQFVPMPESGVFWYSGTSRFQTGLNFFVNRFGPGSANLRAVRVKGYGLPASGIVLAQPGANTCSDQNWFSIANKTGDINVVDAGPAGGQFGSAFWLQRTWDVQGSDATSVRPNPFAANLSKATQTANWSHPGDFGAPAGSANYIDFTKLGAWTRYTFEFFYGSETAPSKTLSAPIVHSVLPAAAGASMSWHPIDNATRSLLDPSSPSAGATSSMQLGWTQNTATEPIYSVTANTYKFSDTGNPSTGTPPAIQNSVVSANIPVPKLTTSATVTSPTSVNDPNCGSSGQFIGLTGDGMSARSLQFRYRMLDGMQKEASAQYN